jgi:hypothetical protein
MNFKKIFCQLLSFEFLSGFLMAFVPMGLSLLLMLHSYFHNEHTASINNSGYAAYSPTNEEIISCFIREDPRVITYYKCNGYTISISRKENLPESIPRLINTSGSLFLPLVPKELEEYVDKINGKLTLNDLSNILLPCAGKKDNEIIYSKITDYYNVGIDLYGITIDEVDGIIPIVEKEQ